MLQGNLPKGPERRERELMEAYDLMERKTRRLPDNLPWQQIIVTRTAEGLRCRVVL